MNIFQHPGFWLIIAVIGIFLLVVGIIYWEINRRNNAAQPWWVYFLIIAGAIIAIGAFIAAIYFIAAQNPTTV